MTRQVESRDAWRSNLSPELAAQVGALWGKSNAGGTREEPRPNLLVQHLFDALAVGELLWDRYVAAGIRQRLDEMTSGQGRQFLAWLCGLHDVGKASRAFQAQDEGLADRVRAAGLSCPLPSRRGAQSWRHDRAGGLAVNEALQAGWTDGGQHVDWVWPLIAGHHGVIPSRGQMRPPGGGRNDPHGQTTDWQQVREWLIGAVTAAAGYRDLAATEPSRLPPRADQLLLSGLIIMADWIASDDQHFPGISDLDAVSPRGARERAEVAWHALGLRGGWGELPAPTPSSDPIEDRFGLTARFSQTMAVQAARRLPTPGLVIVEAPMGEGKTEAAQAIAEELAARFGMDGLFMGMPTQATSDPMFDRVLAWSQSISTDLQVALLHGKRMFNKEWDKLVRQRPAQGDAAVETDEFGCPVVHFPVHGSINVDGDPVEGHDGEAPAEWFLGRKRGLLAPLVVGTIDQLLLAATCTRHVMLRYAGLAGKVVVLDEVHAADIYMSQFMNEALAWLGQGRVPVVLLSATLAPDQRRDLVRSYVAGASSNRDVDVSDLPDPPGYPSVTCAWVEEGLARYDVQATTPWRPSARVAVEVLNEAPDAVAEPVVSVLRRDLAEGGCALVIRNTVGRAQETYEALEPVFPGDVRLLHGRFSAADRADLTQGVLDQLGPGAEACRPERLIVVATQLAEQSFDIDADILISDLAPIDLLLQRAGRLHRHRRAAGERPEPVRTPRLLVTGVDLDAGPVPWLPGGSRAIYGSYHLLCTAVEVQAAARGKGWSIPDEVPRLVAGVYGESPNVPDTWSESVDAAREEYRLAQDKRAAKAAEWVLAGLDDLPKKHLADLNGKTSVAEEHVRVRDGDSSTEILFLRHDRDGGDYRSLNGISLGINGENARDYLVDVLGGTVRLSAYDVELAEEVAHKLKPLPEWRDHPWLKHTRVVCLFGDRSDDLPSFTLSYDRCLGLRWERKA